MTRERLSQLSREDLLHLTELFDIDVVDFDTEDREGLEDEIFEAIETQRRDRERSNTFPVSYHEQRFDSLDELFGRELSPNEWGFDFPASYNVTRIELMLRDPAWAFTYWDISVQDKTRLLKDEGFRHLLLRLEEINSGKNASDLSVVDVPVQLTDTSWYINLQTRETHYRVHLIASLENREELLVSSQKIQVPRGGLTQKLEVMESFETDALIALSGIEQLGERGLDSDIPQRILQIKDSWEA